MASAEPEVSRDLDLDWVAQHTGSFLEAINEPPLGYWPGRVPGIARFLSSAAACTGVTYDGALPRQEGWGLPRAMLRQARLRQACRDMGDFPSSSHLQACRIWSWPMKLTGTLTGAWVAADSHGMGDHLLFGRRPPASVTVAGNRTHRSLKTGRRAPGSCLAEAKPRR